MFSLYNNVRLYFKQFPSDFAQYSDNIPAKVNLLQEEIIDKIKCEYQAGEMSPMNAIEKVLFRLIPESQDDNDFINLKISPALLGENYSIHISYADGKYYTGFNSDFYNYIITTDVIENILLNADSNMEEFDIHSYKKLIDALTHSVLSEDGEFSL